MTILKEKVGLNREDIKKLQAMRPGMSMDLQLSAPTGIKRVKTEFIGMDGTRSIILKFPDETRWGPLRDAIYADNSMVVRYIYEEDAGEVVAFKARINIVLSKPLDYIFTSFPLSIQCHALRTEQRAQSHVPVSMLQLSTGKALFDGLIIDLSLSGCRIAADRAEIKQKIELKEAITLKIKNPDGQTSDLLGLVMNQKTDLTKHYFGVKFDASEQVVEGLLHQLMLT